MATAIGQDAMQTEFHIQGRGAPALRNGIVLPQAAPQETKFETNRQPLQTPHREPKTWPELPPPGKPILLAIGPAPNREPR